MPKKLKKSVAQMKEHDDTEDQLSQASSNMLEEVQSPRYPERVAGNSEKTITRNWVTYGRTSVRFTNEWKKRRNV